MDLGELEAKSIYIIREAYRKYGDRLAILTSFGKDSIAMLHLVRKAFLGHVPIPAIHINTGHHLRQIYEFRDWLVKEWNLNLIIARNAKALKAGMSPKRGRLACCSALKTRALQQAIKRHHLKALLVAIRRDEHGVRAKERYFSPRDAAFRWDYQRQPPELWDQYNKLDETGTHLRIHPMLHWTELDVWSYVKREGLPVNPLYFARRGPDGKLRRYRSLGCEPCTVPIESDAQDIDQIIWELKTTRIAERAGRAQDKEKAYIMQRLRALGYM